ncbi:hypothetical protein scyTo_0015118, partial [Scyliorhinus torazame]|nr:hypothetical protein [Scyliorhinus torazame]
LKEQVLTNLADQLLQKRVTAGGCVSGGGHKLYCSKNLPREKMEEKDKGSAQHHKDPGKEKGLHCRSQDVENCSHIATMRDHNQLI